MVKALGVEARMVFEEEVLKERILYVQMMMWIFVIVLLIN